MLRAGPFSEDSVISLVNRRFIPFFFDIGKDSFAGDDDARDFLIKLKPEYGKSSVPTPPCFVFTPDGKLLTEIDNYTDAHKFLDILKKVLEKNSEYNKLDSTESKLVEKANKEGAFTDLLEAGKLYAELSEYGKAEDYYRSAIEKGKDKKWLALFHLGRLFSKMENWKEMIKCFSITGKMEPRELAQFKDDMELEMIYEDLCKKDFKAAKAALVHVMKRYPDSDRLGEMKYNLALAHYKLGEKEEAKKIWKDLKKNVNRDRWVRRATQNLNPPFGTDNPCDSKYVLR